MNGSLIITSLHVLSSHRPTKIFGLMVSYLQLVNPGENEARNGDSFRGGGECTCKMAYVSVWRGREGSLLKDCQIQKLHWTFIKCHTLWLYWRKPLLEVQSGVWQLMHEVCCSRLCWPQPTHCGLLTAPHYCPPRACLVPLLDICSLFPHCVPAAQSSFLKSNSMKLTTLCSLTSPSRGLRRSIICILRYQVPGTETTTTDKINWETAGLKDPV